ncbi:MAG: polyprenyl synthetase family protein [Ornithinimicrobium sp.]
MRTHRRMQTVPRASPVVSLPSPDPPATLSGHRDLHPLDAVDLRARVAEVIHEHLHDQRAILSEVGEPVLALLDAIGDLLTGGKRLRAAFLYWGYRAFDGPDTPALIRAASAMEIFQAAALLHDDVMDNSDLRRGRPTAHRAFEAHHADAAWSGSSSSFGHAAATLAGDMCLNWCDEVFANSGLPPEHLQRARGTFDLMRTQLMGGQYLDVLTSAQDWDHLSHHERIDQCRRVIRFKSAKYSIEHPLLIGASAIGASAADKRALSAYGLALGEAFQLRDDLLGVYGDPEATGKPAGDDLREGKRTILIALAMHHGSERETTTVMRALGNPDLTQEDVHRVRAALMDSGAVQHVEDMIEHSTDQAREALASVHDMTPHGEAALRALIDISTARSA